MKKVLLAFAILLGFQQLHGVYAYGDKDLQNLAIASSIGNFGLGFLVNACSDNTLDEKMVGNGIGVALALCGNVFQCKFGQNTMQEVLLNGEYISVGSRTVFDEDAYAAWATGFYLLGGLTGYVARAGLNKACQGIRNVYNRCVGVQEEATEEPTHIILSIR